MVSHSSDGIFAPRQGQWKYVQGKAAKPVDRLPKARAAEMTQQPYNLKDDPKEQNNVIDANRDVAARMQDLLSTQQASGHSRKPSVEWRLPPYRTTNRLELRNGASPGSRF